MSDERAFKNPFPEYNGEVILDEENKLKGDIRSKLLSSIKTLLQTLDSNTVDDERNYSIYTGSSGQAFLRLHLYEKLSGQKDESYLHTALGWLKPSLSRLKGSRVSFLCGDAGPLALAAVVYSKLGDKRKCWDYISRLDSMCKDVCRDPNLPDELLYGRCGYLSSLLFIQQHLGSDSINRETMIMVVEAILKSGEKLASQQRCPYGLMYEWHDKAYLGAAHGLAGIYFMLLQVKEPALQEKIHNLVRPCIDYMLTLRFASGNCPSSIGSSNGDKLVHWCHGAPGWVHLFVLAYKIFKDKRYLEAAQDCTTVVWKRGLLRKGYGICHGAAGNAYTFLTMYKLTGQQKYLYYTCKFAEWCCDYGKHGCRTPDTPFSMFEGMAGTVYFLADLLEPKESLFPAFEFKLY